jgi:hypothetical protein
LKFGSQRAYNRFMSKPFANAVLLLKAILLVSLLATATTAQAQTRHRRERGSPDTDRPAPAVAADKRDSVVAAPGPYMGRPYWLALAQCGGIYFKLNVLYTDIAVHARVTKPDPTLNNEVTKKLNDAIKTATIFYSAAERLLINDRGIERIDAVLVYNDQARAAGDRIKGSDTAAAIIAGLNAAKTCPALYHACQGAYPKACSDQLAPIS